MKNIVACYKWVIDEVDIRVNSDLSIDTSQAKGKISEYDRNTIEAAVRIKDASEGEAYGLTFGTADISKSAKDALSRGLDAGYCLKSDTAADADGQVTAKALATAIQKIDDVGIVLCSEGSSDAFARQTAPRIGVLLDWPVVTSVCEMSLDGTTLTAVRKLEDCTQTVKVSLPVVVAVLPEINPAPIPGLKSVLAAGKKPVSEFDCEELSIDISPKTQVISKKGYVMDRKNVLFSEGDVATRVDELVNALRKEGVL